jgi:hypothetical protein
MNVLMPAQPTMNVIRGHVDAQYMIWCLQKVVAGRFQRLRVLGHGVRIAVGIVGTSAPTSMMVPSNKNSIVPARRLTNRCRGTITATIESSPRRT